MAPPASSHTIWFTQRVGSTWPCDALAATGVAGRPRELPLAAPPGDLLRHHDAATARDLVAILRRAGSTADGVFGVEHGFQEPHFARLVALLRAGVGGGARTRLDVWEAAFPNHRHVLMTRRNEVRLAASWWCAIRSGEWHRRRGAPAAPPPAEDAHDFDALDHLLAEAVMREAGIQALLSEGGVVPLTVAYEDLAADPDGTLRRVLAFLGVPEPERFRCASDLERIADPVVEGWVQRFREEKQRGWPAAGW